MYKRLSAIMFPVCALALIGAAIWGYQENQEKNAILIKAENQYQRAFHDLSYHMDRLNSEIGKTIAVNSEATAFYTKGLVNVWRIASQAQNEINQLPLTLLPFNETEAFLSNISNFSYRMAMRDLNKNPLSNDETQTLQTLYTQSKEMTHQLQGVQSKVLSNNLRWMDVETALATQEKQLDNTIVDGFKTVDKKVKEEYSEVNWGPSMASIFENRNFSSLSGNDVTADEVKQKAVQFLALPKTPELQVTENGNGTEYSSFSVSGKLPGTEQDLQMDLTKKGGYVIYYSAAREIAEKNVDLQGAQEAAQEYLQARGYTDMSPISYDEYNNIASIAFVRKQGNVFVYPEKISIKVALDHAEVIGFQASDYVFEHKDRQIPSPKLSAEEAKKRLHSNFRVDSQALSLIKNDQDQEVLCHEFSGKINGADYKIFINAETGADEKVEQFPTQG